MIVCFICLAALVVVHYHNRGKTSENNSIGFVSNPSRIVSLAPNLTEILFALGLDERVVSVSGDSDYPADASSRRKLGTFWAPDIEAVIASKPDLIITLWFEQQKSVAESLKRLGYKALTLRIEKIEELFTSIEKIGAATGCEKRAGQLVKNIDEQLSDLREQLALANKVRVLWVIQIEPLRVAGRNTFINELIELAGGENAIGATIAKYPQIGTEELLVCDAEVIIQSAMGAGDIPAQQKAAETFWGRWPGLPAVKNNRIYVVQPDTILRLGPRLPQGLRLVARCLHPDIAAQTQYDTQ